MIRVDKLTNLLFATSLFISGVTMAYEDSYNMTAALIQNNIRQFVVSMGSKAGFELKNFGNITSAYSDTPGPDYNLMFDYQAPKVAIADLQQALSYSQQKRYPFIIVRDQQNPSKEVEDLLAKFKYQKAGTATRMAIAHETINLDKVDRLSVQQVKDQTMLIEFCNITDEAFSRPAGSSKLFFDPIPNLFSESNELKLYLAFAKIDGQLKPVAAAMLYLPKDKSLLAGHYGWAVREKSRKQGIMTNLVKNMILTAKENGFISSVAQCYDASVRLAHRLGFKEYGVLDIYTNAGQEPTHENTL